MKASLSFNRAPKTTASPSASTIFFQVLDLTFCLKSSHARLLDDGSQFLRGFRRKPLTGVKHTFEIRDALSSRRGTPSGGRTPKTVQIRMDGRIRYRHVPVAQLALYLQGLINLLVLRAHWGCDRYCLVHAAVVAKGGRGVLICGKSGCGKSSLSLALMFRYGYQYLTDEIACWDAHQGKIVAYPKAIVLKEKGYRRFQKKHPRLLARMHDARIFSRKLWYINPALHFPSKIRKTARIRLVVFPIYREKGQTQVSPISKVRALLSLHKQRFDANGFGQNDFEKLAELMRRATASQVHYHDVFEAADTIDALMKHPHPA